MQMHLFDVRVQHGDVPWLIYESITSIWTVLIDNQR